MSIVSTESYVHTILLRPLTRFKMGWPDAYKGGSIGTVETELRELLRAAGNWR